jgi:hypothetical protein
MVDLKCAKNLFFSLLQNSGISYLKILITLEYQVRMWLDSYIKCHDIISLPASYPSILRNFTGNSLACQNIIQFPSLFVGNNFNIDIIRKE